MVNKAGPALIKETTIFEQNYLNFRNIILFLLSIYAVPHKTGLGESLNFILTLAFPLSPVLLDFHR